MDVRAFSLEPSPPFRLDLTVWGLRRRPDDRIDRWDGRAYRRVLIVKGEPVAVAVTQEGPAGRPVLQVAATAARTIPRLEAEITRSLERLLGLRVDLAPFYDFVAADPRLDALVRRFRGFKPPRFPTVFEALINAIACQQVTLTLGIRLLNSLAGAYGLSVSSHEDSHAFPEPGTLAAVVPEDLRALHFSRQKAQAIIDIAETVADGRLDLERLADLDDAAVVEELRRLRGVGRWTAEYVLLRGLGRLHVFPGDDVGAVNNLRHWLDLTAPLGYDEVRRLLGPWNAYGGLIYLHLLLSRLEEAGVLSGDPSA